MSYRFWKVLVGETEVDKPCFGVSSAKGGKGPNVKTASTWRKLTWPERQSEFRHSWVDDLEVFSAIDPGLRSLNERIKQKSKTNAQQLEFYTNVSQMYKVKKHHCYRVAVWFNWFIGTLSSIWKVNRPCLVWWERACDVQSCFIWRLFWKSSIIFN